jgi:hypothetical protein
MASDVSDFSVARQCLSRRTFFCDRSNSMPLCNWKSPRPAFDTGARNGVLCGSQLSHQSLKKIGLDEV